MIIKEENLFFLTHTKGRKVASKNLVGCGSFGRTNTRLHGVLLVHGIKVFQEHGLVFNVAVLNQIKYQLILIILDSNR